MNLTISKVDSKTSDIIFNYVLSSKYNEIINRNATINDFIENKIDRVKQDLIKEAKKYIFNVGEDRYSAEELVNDFLDRL
jgi:hypothetical protein